MAVLIEVSQLYREGWQLTLLNNETLVFESSKPLEIASQKESCWIIPMTYSSKVTIVTENKTYLL